MHTVSAVVLLTAVVMAQADHMSDLLNLPHHKEHLYIFDVTSKASVEDLKAALSNFTLQGSYKVIGERRYLFVFNSNDTGILRSLRFPAGSSVTQYAVEHVSELLEMYGNSSETEEDNVQHELPNTVLLFFDVSKNFPEVECSKSFEMEMKEYQRKFAKIHSITRPLIYTLVAGYPTRMLEIQQVEENAFQNVLKEVTEIFGGTGSLLSSIKRIIKI